MNLNFEYGSILLLFIFIIFSSFIDVSCIDFNKTSVVLIHVMVRHGHRTPKVPDTLNTTELEKFCRLWPLGSLQLTNKGKMEQYELGEWFRERYSHLIPSDAYNNDFIYVQSTNTDRTIMSAQCFMSALLKPNQKQIWNKDLIWQPIPIHTLRPVQDVVLNFAMHCPAYEEFLNSKEFKTLMIPYEDMIELVNTHTNLKINNTQDLGFFYETTNRDLLEGFPVEDWVNDIYPEPMTEAYIFNFAILTWNEQLKRVFIGPFLKEITDNMALKINGNLQPDRKMMFYFAHENNLACLLHTLDIFDWQIPPLTSAIIIELRKDKTDNYFITILNKNTTSEPALMKLPGCKQVCPINDFLDIVSQHIASDWNVECMGNSSMSHAKGFYFSLVFWILIYFFSPLYYWIN